MKFLRLLREIENSKDKIIIAEGKKDEESLKELGFKNIFLINKTNKGFNEQIEEIIEKAEKEKRPVVILTDFDKKGFLLYKKMKQILSRSGIKIDDKLRTQIRKNKINYIEGLANFLSRKVKFK